MNPTMCCLYWNGDGCGGHEWKMPCHSGTSCTIMEWCSHWWMMKAMYPLKFVHFSQTAAYLLDKQAFFVGEAHSSSSFFLLCHSLGPFFCAPLRYFFPVFTQLSCFALTSKSSQASLAVPLLKNFLFNFSHTAAPRMHVGPFLGSCLMQATLCLSNIIFSTLTILCSSIVSWTGSATGFRNFSGTFSWTRGLTAAFRMVWNVSLLVILARELKCTAAVDKCAKASDVWLNINTIISVSSLLCCFSGSLWMNVHGSGMSCTRSTASGPSLVMCCWRWRQPGSLINLIMTSRSAGSIETQCFTMIFLRLLIILGNASL